MFALLLISLLAVDTSHSLECIANCSIGKFSFSEPLRIPNGQCQQRISGPNCYVNLELNYHDRTYEVRFGTSGVSRDLIYIRSGPYVSYDISYLCSKETDCVISYVQKRLGEMVRLNYNARRIYEELTPLIVHPSRNGTIQCYDMKNSIVSCSPGQFCSLDYDAREKKIRSRGCKVIFYPRVLVYNGGTYSSLDVECTQNLCNGDATLAQIKTILFNNGLTNADGLPIAGVAKAAISRFLVTLALIVAFISSF